MIQIEINCPYDNSYIVIDTLDGDETITYVDSSGSYNRIDTTELFRLIDKNIDLIRVDE